MSIKIWNHPKWLSLNVNLKNETSRVGQLKQNDNFEEKILDLFLSANVSEKIIVYPFQVVEFAPISTS